MLERPEYGFATYFFELLDSLPIEWQINRLVTCMKLTNFSRVSLIEDKPLSVMISYYIALMIAVIWIEIIIYCFVNRVYLCYFLFYLVNVFNFDDIES